MKYRSGFALALLATILLLALTSSAAFAVVYVKWDSPGPTFDGTSWGKAYHTVQAGLNAASSGDQVWVARGTYVECITLKAGVALYGGYSGVGSTRDIAAHVTILDGNQAGSVVICPSGAGPATVIDGFTIRNGRADNGGGIYCNATSPTITNNNITGNTGVWWGGGIYCENSSPTIANNTITANGLPRVGGAGICCLSSSPTITSNRISGNDAFWGGGILCYYSSPTITNNTIAGNHSPGLGGGIACYFSSATITNNTITGNTADGGWGGG